MAFDSQALRVFFKLNIMNILQGIYKIHVRLENLNIYPHVTYTQTFIK